jgi:hypothetical protein
MPYGLGIHYCSHILVDSLVEIQCNQADKYMKENPRAPDKQHLDHMEMVDKGFVELLALELQLQGEQLQSA